MSAKKPTPTTATQGKRSGIASHHSAIVSHSLASPSSSTTQSRWSTRSDISDSGLTPVLPRDGPHLDLEIVHSGDNLPTTLNRLSSISETSSLTSASAEFDGDISIVAPLGQEENTDLHSLQSLPIPVFSTLEEGKFDIQADLKAYWKIKGDIDSNQRQRQFDQQESVPAKVLPEESTSTLSVKDRLVLKTSHLTRPRNYQHSLTREKSQEIGPSTKGDLTKSVITPLLSSSQQSQSPSISKQTKDRPVCDQKDQLRRCRSSIEETPKRSTGTISSSCPPRMATSLEDITSLRLWKGVVAEFVGTLLLTLVGCGSCINLRGDKNVTSPVVQIALCFGLSVATVVWAIAHVSGGHVNPAVTCAMLATRKISLVKAAFFIVFQLVGAVVGAGILYGLTPQDYVGNLGCTLVSDKLTPAQGLGVELFVTFVLVFTVFASCDGKRKDLNGSAPLTIGLSVTMCHLWAIDYTGSSMNTARSFGPALIKGNWDDHWVYWAGPIVGGVVAGLLYEHLFAMNASITKVKACMLSSDYDDEKYRARKLKVRIIEEEENDQDGPTGLDDNGSYPLTEKDSSPA